MIIIPASWTLPNNPLIGWHNVVTRSNVSADQQAATAPVSQLASPQTYNPWSGTSAAEQSVKVSLDAAEPIDYVGMAVHNLGTAGIAYNVEYSANDVDWSAADSTKTPGDDGVILHVFNEQSAQYWRVRFEAGTEAPSLAVLYFGRILRSTRRIYVGHTPITLGREAEVRSGRSESGQFLGRVAKRRLYACEVSLNNLDPDWYRENFDPFAESAIDDPFFFGWRPLDRPTEVAYAWAMRDIVPVNQRSNGMMQVSFPIQGLTGVLPSSAFPSSS